jgi:hypothetical protein
LFSRLGGCLITKTSNAAGKVSGGAMGQDLEEFKL